MWLPPGPGSLQVLRTPAGLWLRGMFPNSFKTGKSLLMFNAWHNEGTKFPTQLAWLGYFLKYGDSSLFMLSYFCFIFIIDTITDVPIPPSPPSVASFHPAPATPSLLPSQHCGLCVWVMHICSLACWLQEANKQFSLVPQGVFKLWRWCLSCWPTDKEVLGKSPPDCNSYLTSLFSQPSTYPFPL